MATDDHVLAEELAQLPAEANRRGDEAERRIGAGSRTSLPIGLAPHSQPS